MSMRAERTRYLASLPRGVGGDAAGFRAWIRDRAAEDPRLFPVDYMRDQAANRAWETPTRRKAPDLFSIAGEDVPEILTRYKAGFRDEDDEKDAFEKILSINATVQDRYDDAVIHLHNASKTNAAAMRDMEQADECRRRARGDMAKPLIDLADPKKKKE